MVRLISSNDPTSKALRSISKIKMVAVAMSVPPLQAFYRAEKIMKQDIIELKNE
jgi:hypothetical protein